MDRRGNKIYTEQAIKHHVAPSDSQALACMGLIWGLYEQDSVSVGSGRARHSTFLAGFLVTLTCWSHSTPGVALYY